MTRIRKSLSALVAAAVIVNAATVVGLPTRSAVKDFDTTYKSIIDGCLGYVISQENEDGSVGDSCLVNDTADALYIYNVAAPDYSTAAWNTWAYAHNQQSQTDGTARIAAALHDWRYIQPIITEQQNPDGGWGLNSGYSSDVLDTLFVLDYMALRETSSSADSWIVAHGLPAVEYMFTQMNDDGLWSYNAKSGSDDVLTAMAVCDISKVQQTSAQGAKENDERLAKAVEYMRGSLTSTYTDEELEYQLWRDLALMQYDGGADTMQLIGKLEAAQQENGSFGDSISATKLAVRLLKQLKGDRLSEILSCKTELSAEKCEYGQSVTATTNITYTANYEAAYQLKTTVMNGEDISYEGSVSVTLDPNAESVSVPAATFDLIEAKDNGIKVLVDLCMDDRTVWHETIELEMTPAEVITYSTEVSGAELALDSDCVPAGVQANVSAKGSVFYATNTPAAAQLRLGLYRNGELVQENTADCVLDPSRNVVSAELLKADIKSDKAEKFVFKLECIYEDKVVFTDEKTFEVIECKAVEPTTEPTTEPSTDPTAPTGTTEPSTEPTTEPPAEDFFDVKWFSPVLSDLMLYADTENSVDGQVGIIYDSNVDFSGTVSITAVSDGKTVAENTAEVELPAQSLLESTGTIGSGQSAALPKFETEQLITFAPTNVGTTEVTATLSDKDGNVIATAKKTVTVIAKPVQDLVVKSTKSKDGSYVSLSWNNVSNEHENYTYQLERREVGKSWEVRPIWNEEDSIRVLNIYPYVNNFEGWMKNALENEDIPADKNIFDVEAVYIDDFNKEPEKYMKSEDGTWLFDVIFFGTWDCNNRKDLSDASYEVVQAFADSGHGVLFGHDTICTNFGHYNFVKFADQLGIKVISDTSVIATDSVSVIRLGTLTNYPWTIRGQLKIPSTHSYGQYVGGPYDATEWMELNAEHRIDPDSGAHSNFYLVTKKNLAMIQTGHSDGAASDDERKVLANTIFYLYQLSKATTAKDKSFYDLAAPDVPKTTVDSADSKHTVSLASKDNGTTYEYSILAVPNSEGGKQIASNITKHEAISGLAGFVCAFSTSAEPDPTLLKYDETGEFVQNIIAADANGNATFSFAESEMTGDYLHVFAVDKANNVSGETVVPFGKLKVTAAISTDKSVYLPNEKVAVTAETVANPYGITADCTVEIRDEYDNLTASLVQLEAQTLAAGAKVPYSGEWTVPEALFGRYKAVITWTQEGRTVAAAEALFKVTGEESIADSIASDKKVYSLSDPINLSSAVYNKSVNIVENDLTLKITVTDSEKNPVAEYSRGIASMNPKADISFADAITPNTLRAGDYTAVAAVLQDNREIATDSAQFTVEAPAECYAKEFAVGNGFYFNHDVREFDKSILSGMKIVTNKGGKSEEADIDLARVKLKGVKNGGSCPQDVYDETQTDFIYTIAVYFDDEPLKYEDGSDVTFRAFIGVKGDTDFDNKVGASDATNVLVYYAKLSTGGEAESTRFSAGEYIASHAETADELDEFAAFLADVDLDVYSEGNYKMRKTERMINATDASFILKFYSYLSTGGTDKNKGWNSIIPNREEKMTQANGGDVK
ncbi:MAG: cellulose-binding protein CttA-related protein [Ruminococcus sp.]|nr:cellulose-binding protein CttA-related protein [Ruminococcus sp.]